MNHGSGCQESAVGMPERLSLFQVTDGQFLPISPHNSVNAKSTAFASKGIKRLILLPNMSGHGLKTHPQVASDPRF